VDNAGKYYLITKPMSSLFKKEGPFLPLFFLLSLIMGWAIVVRLFAIEDYVFPSPLAIVRSIVENYELIYENLKITALESVLGFLLGSGVALFVGVLIAESSLGRRILLPYIVGSNAIPIVAVAPLVVFWFGHGLASKVVVSAFLCFFPLAINTYRGLSETPSVLKEFFDLYGGTRMQFLLKARLPFAAPYIFTGAKLNATFAVIGAIVAEFIGATSGLGFGMLSSTYNLDVPRLWSYLVASVLFGMAAYAIVWLGEKWYFAQHS
jgi:NitT/TauT family transport system permease protein